jgi:uncharacterized protein
MSNLVPTLARELSLPSQQVTTVVALLDEGHTIPFLARYRKEATGGLDEVALRQLQDSLGRLRRLEARREEVREALDAQGVLSAELSQAVAGADSLARLEDLYLPYRPKRRTRASTAREQGLEPLAALFTLPNRESPEAAARRFVNADKGIASVEEALAGARDIVAERVAEDANVRGRARTLSLKEASLSASKAPKAEDPQGKYAHYHQYTEPVARVAPHRTLAVDRGEAEKVLRVSLELPEARILGFMREALRVPSPAWQAQGELAIADGYKRLLAPAIEREVREALTEKAQAYAIEVFAANVKALLLQPPLKNKVVMGIDPGFRTGCKVVVVDPTGQPLDAGTTIFPHEPQKQWQQALDTLRGLMARHAVQVVAIGNGTASRETERLVAEAVRGTQAVYAIVSEAGASVYSASEVARDEFPDLDATQRGNISIARRLQDPLAELVKIDPAAIGVGMYQHDLAEKALTHALAGVVEDAVNHVGVDLNTASVSLLTHVAGLNSKVAKAIVAHRAEHGPFKRRADLRAVKGLGAKTYEQAAGFLRVPGGEEPLDATPIHPETYPAVRKLLTTLSLKAEAGLPQALRARRTSLALPALARDIGVGEPTLQDMLDALERPGRDPREDLPAPHLRQDVLKLEDLKPGMRLTGTVRNVVPFGVFVDIGVKQDGLVHVSELAEGFVRDPLGLVSVGAVMEVEVVEVDKARGRIALSRKRALAAAGSAAL